MLALALVGACGRLSYDPGPDTADIDAGRVIDRDVGSMDAPAPDAPAPDAIGLDAPALDAFAPDAPVPRDASFDAPADGGVDAGPDAPTAPVCTTRTDCTATSLCGDDGLCHPILFADDFEDGVIAPDWGVYRFAFEESGGTLHTLPMARPGFDYGHRANGRSGVAAVQIGGSWTDIRVEWRQQNLASIPIVDPSIDECEHVPQLFFRLARFSESWNAPANTFYSTSLFQGCSSRHGDHGAYNVGVAYDSWMPGYGCCPTAMGTSYGVASGTSPVPIADAPIDFVFEAVGARFRLWADGGLVWDATDTVHDAGEMPIPAGGVGFSGIWEEMFWIDDVVIADLTRTAP